MKLHVLLSKKMLQSILGGSKRFQFMSDLHLEVGSQYSTFNVTPSAPYLILAGDIGRLVNYQEYLQFLERHVVHFQKIFLVLGNHEFHGTSVAEGRETARRLEREPSVQGKLIVLDKARYDIPDSDVTILGCTLWSHVPEDKQDIVRSKVKDFKWIENWSVDVHNANHLSDLNWLQEQVRGINEQRKIVIATHHGPSTSQCSSPDKSGNPWSSAFATDVLHHRWPGVKAWIFGHTHYTTEFVEESVRVMSNQRGYVLPGAETDRAKQSGFNEHKVLRL